MHRISIALFDALAVLVAASRAEATAGYVCKSRLMAPMTAGSVYYGDHGNIFFSVYTSPDCAGTLVGSYVLCSANATWGSCAIASECGSGITYLYSPAALGSIAQSLQNAASIDQRVDVSTCSSGGEAAYVDFLST